MRGIRGRMTVQISTAAEKLELPIQANLHFVRKGNGGVRDVNVVNQEGLRTMLKGRVEKQFDLTVNSTANEE